MKTRLLILIVSLGFCSIFISCTTLGSQEMTYIGDATPIPNVMGKATHFDFAGLGVSSDSYAEEYNKAINDAFQKCSPDVDALTSVKTFKAKKDWPQRLGFAAMIIGVSMLAHDNSKVGVCLSLSGLIASGINTYDFVVLGEPTHKVYDK